MTPLAPSSRLLSVLGPRPWSRMTRQVATPGRLLSTWLLRHRTRRDLRALDDHMLRDIGMDWAAARSEAAKPFWRA